MGCTMILVTLALLDMVGRCGGWKGRFSERFAVHGPIPHPSLMTPPLIPNCNRLHGLQIFDLVACAKRWKSCYTLFVNVRGWNQSSFRRLYRRDCFLDLWIPRLFPMEII
ncbi:hypothetical protein BC830DRAFT_814692 [Chytriomyces sp. MP71]|nr:hypothetical protein BC830DRAFT_814692 [Chytriomyces sp. MP71]